MVGELNTNGSGVLKTKSGVLQTGKEISGGDKVYFIDQSTGNIKSYTTSTAYDIGALTLKNTFDISGEDSYPGGLAFKPDGTVMIMAGYGGDKLYEYTLSTGWDISTATYQTSISPGANAMGVQFNDDGTKVYAVDFGGSIVEFGLSTAYDITTNTNNDDLDVSGKTTEALGVAFNGDGTKVYIADRGGALHSWSLSTAYDVSTGSFLNSKSTGASPSGIDFNGDGTKVFVSDKNDIVEQFPLSTAYDISTLGSRSASYDTGYTTRDVEWKFN